MLSGNGDHVMTKLSDTQAVILSTASQRDDGAVLPLPETLKIKGSALERYACAIKPCVASSGRESCYRRLLLRCRRANQSAPPSTCRGLRPTSIS